MTHEEYSKIQAMNWSSLVAMGTSPLMYQWRLQHARPDTKEFRLGRVIHCAALEPDEFERRYLVEPAFGDCRKTDRTTKEDAKANKTARDEWRATVPADAVLIDAGTMDIVRHAADSLQRHADAVEALRGGQKELLLRWKDPLTGILCKGRGDQIRRDRVVDLKSTSKPIDHNSFAREAARYMYHGQLAWYHDGAIEAGELARSADYPQIVAVQTVEPYDVAVFDFTPSTMEGGRHLRDRFLRLFADCAAANYWPGVAPTRQPLNLPLWAPGMMNDDDPDDPFETGDRTYE